MLSAVAKTKALGNIQYGQEYHFGFTVENVSTERVKITKLVVSCGSCTRASIVGDTLNPGQKGDINVIFTPGSTGIQNKFVDVYYESGGTPMPALRLTFNAVSHG
jgi:hypothetical protein